MLSRPRAAWGLVAASSMPCDTFAVAPLPQRRTAQTRSSRVVLEAARITGRGTNYRLIDARSTSMNAVRQRPVGSMRTAHASALARDNKAARVFAEQLVDYRLCIASFRDARR